MPEEAQPTCIYCPRTDFSQEHYLPRCLGTFRGFEALNDRVCRECNEALGLLDQEFCRTSPEALHRRFLGIRGRKHHKPFDPFQETSLGRAPFVIRARLPEQDLEVLWEASPGKVGIREMRQLVVVDAEGETQQIRLTEAMFDDPSRLRDRVSELDIKHAKEVRFFAADEEVERVACLLRKLFPRMRFESGIPTHEGKRTRTEVRVTVFLDKYSRAIAKIAFHYFLKQFPRYRGTEDQFAATRAFIRTGQGIRCARDIQRRVLTTKLPIAEMLPGYDPTWQGHLLLAGYNASGFHAWARFFLHPDLPVISHKIWLGPNPSPVVHESARAHRFAYFEGGRSGGHDGEMLEVPRMLLFRLPS